MRHSHFSRLVWVFELLVAAASMKEIPAFFFEPGNDFSAIHIRIVHIIHIIVKAFACYAGQDIWKEGDNN